MEGEGSPIEAQPERRELPRNVEEVFPGGFRITKGMTYLDVPESWALFDGQGLYVIDPGGELPIDTPLDALSAKSLAAAATLSFRSDKLEAIRELEQQLQAPVKGILLTHGDADHTNNIENVAVPEVPIYVGRKGWWSTLSPEKQFAAGRVNLEKSSLTNGDAGDLTFRDLGMQAYAEVANNPRGGRMRHERKQQLAARFSDYPESFALDGATIEVIPLPGHAPEEVGFYIPEQKIMIGGDLLSVSKPDQVGRLDIFLPQANIYQALETLAHLQTMDIERFYPAHGNPILGSEKFREYLNRVEMDARAIIQKTLAIQAEHPRATVAELRPLVFSPDLHMKGMAPRSEETWILSILRDQPADPEHVLGAD